VPPAVALSNYSQICFKTGIFVGFSLYCIILISPEGTARGGGARGKIIVFRLQRSSIRIQRSSVGCSVAEKGKA
jgi:hypothetical protein